MRKLSVLLTFALALMLAGCDIEIDGMNNERFQKDFRFSYPLKSGGTFTLENMNGSVDIAGWDREEAEITGVKYARSEALRDEIRIDIQKSDTSITIRTVTPTAMNSGAGARYILRLPHRAILDRVTSSNGKIHVSDMEGAARLKSSNGAIQISKLGGNVDAETSNGAIEANDVRGSAHLHTSNGHVTVSRVDGPIDVTSSNGSITVETTAAAKELTARTSNSSITVRIPATSPARLRAGTSNGGITCAFETDYKHMDRHHIEGTINGGSSASPLIDLSTSNGSIKIEKQ